MTFKQKLMNEAQTSYNNQIPAQNLSKQKSLLATKDYGNAPDLNWVKDFGGSDSDYAEDIVSDENENIYLAGFFLSNVMFGDDVLYSSDYQNGFITKCSSTGDFLWAKLISSDDSDDVCTDLSGNSYVAHNNFITKFNTGGTEQWTEETDNYPFAFTINSSDKLLTTGNTDGLIFLSQLDNNATEEWVVNFDGCCIA